MLILKAFAIFCSIWTMLYAHGDGSYKSSKGIIKGRCGSCSSYINLSPETIQERLLDAANCDDPEMGKHNFDRLIPELQNLNFCNRRGRTFLHQWVHDNNSMNAPLNMDILHAFLSQQKEKSQNVNLNIKDVEDKTVLDALFNQNELRFGKPFKSKAMRFRDDVYENRLEILKKLLDHGASLTLEEYLSINFAEENSGFGKPLPFYLNMDIIDYFLDQPHFDVNKANRDGKTIFYIVVEKAAFLSRSSRRPKFTS